MSDCIQLFSLPGLREDYKEQDVLAASQTIVMNRDALEYLNQQFSDCPNLIPIAVIGDSSCAKSILLDKWLGFDEDEGPFGKFVDKTGLITYPKKQNREGNSQFLLLELSGKFFKESGDARIEFTKRKMLQALMSIVSVCILCFEKISLFDNLTKVLKLYEKLQQKSSLRLSKFFICVENQVALTKEPLTWYSTFKESENMRYCEFFYRGRDGFKDNEFRRMIDLLSQEHFHNEFQTTHEEYRRNLQTTSMPSPPSMIEALTASLNTLGKVATSDFPLEKDMGVAGDLTENFALQVEEPPAKACASCVQLLSLPIESDEKKASDAELKVTLDEEKLVEIEVRFNGCERLIPILVIGSSECGKSIILDNMIGESGNHPFASFKKGFSGVIAYPEPVEMGSYQFLLMEMSGMNFAAQDEEGVLKKKTLHALLSVTSVCIICLEKSSMFASISEMMKIYEGMQSKSKLQISKFFICVESEEIRNGIRGYPAFCRGNYMNICEFFYRGNPGFEKNEFLRMKNMLSHDTFHNKYEETHRPCQRSLQDPANPEPLSMIQSLSIILKTLGELANCDFALEKHLTIAPNFAIAFSDQQKQLKAQMKLIDCFNQLKSLLFFKNSSFGIEVDAKTMTQLRHSYKMTTPPKPLVVITLFGHQGMGKSTLLNHIVQRLLDSRERREIFKEGNTAGHTTTESLALSQPLNLPNSNSQLMCVDLVGLEGMEIRNGFNQIIQDNLVNSILTITSVYCIIVRNEADDLNFIDKQLKRIVFLNERFHFQVTRIILLFHDKQLECVQNQDLLEKVKKSNEDYFNGQDVILVLNKPNFKDQHMATMCKEFLDKLLSEIDHPKMRQSGKLMNILDTINCIQIISHSREPDLHDVSLSQKQEEIKDKLIKEKTALIKADFDQANCANKDSSLVTDFSDKVDKILSEIGAIDEPGDSNAALSKHVFTALINEKNAYISKLEEVENFYNGIRERKSKEIEAEVEKTLEFIYRDNILVFSFSKASKKERKKFENVSVRYPFMEAQISEILRHHDKIAKEWELSYWKHFAADVAIGVGTLLFGAVAIPGIWAATVLRTTVTVAEYASAGLSSVLGVIGAVKAGNATDFWLSAPQKAYPLYDNELQINLPQQAALESVESATGAVLLLVGKKRLNINIFLNEFIQSAFPFYSNCHSAFNDSSRIQALMFPKIETQVEQSQLNQGLRFGVIIYIRMKEKLATEKGCRLSLLTATLMSKSSLTYFFIDNNPNSDEYIKRILEVYRPEDHRRARVVSPKGILLNPDLVDKFCDRNIDVKWQPMEISLSEDSWRKYFSEITRDLFNTTTITIQDLRDVLTQGKVYLEPHALQMYERRMMHSDITISKKCMETLSDFHYNKEMALFLVVGRKGMKVPNFLNDFMKHTFPLEFKYADVFNDANRYQVHCFRLLEETKSPVSTPLAGVLVYIRMKRKVEKPRSRQLATMAAMFLAKSAWTCFFLDSTEDTNSYLRSILDVYQPQPDERRRAFIIVPTTGMKNTVELENMLRNKSINPVSYQNEDTWKNEFPHIKAHLSDNWPITPQEIKDLVIQAQRFYVQQPAFPILSGNYFSPSNAIESVATNAIMRQELREELEILLIIGKKGINAFDIASKFFQTCYSISAPDYIKFNDISRIQAMTFLIRGTDQDNRKVVRQILVIYIRIKGKTHKPKAQKLSIFAATVLSKSALAYVCNDSSEYQGSYLESILHYYQPKREDVRNPTVCLSLPGDIFNIKLQLQTKSINFIDHETENIVRYVLNAKPITPQEGKDLLTEAQRFYLDEASLPVIEKKWVSSLSLGLIGSCCKLNKDFIKIIGSFHPCENLVILLAAGKKQMRVNLFLNRFMECTYSLSERCSNAFNDSTRVQGVSFHMRGINAENKEIFSQVLMIYIRMKGKTDTPKARRLSKLVATLISPPADLTPPSALPCLFLNTATERNAETQTILSAYEGGKGVPWIILPPGEGKAAITDFKNYFLEKNISAQLQPMNPPEDEQACKDQTLQLTADLLKLKPLSPTGAICHLAIAVEEANKVI